MPMYPLRVRSKKSIGRYDENRQWVYVGEKEQMRSVATQSSLFGIINDEDFSTTYYTPNGYYRRDQRLTETLRWLNAFVFDIDSHQDSMIDVQDRIQEAGLPSPTAIVQTPSGGYHVTYIFSEPIRATAKSIRLYTAIMSHIANDIGSDPAAVGANRIFRTPNEKSLIYFNPENTYKFDIFKSWRDVNHPYIPTNQEDYRILGGNLMLTPALQHLLHTSCPEGRREQTCFTLALAMKASNWSLEQALDAVTDWYHTYCSKITERAGKRSLTLREVLYKVKYVFSKEKLKGPSAEMIRTLSGMDFRYAAYKAYEGRKPRDQRHRSHYSEWKEDTLALLRREKEISGSQKELANLIECPLSTFKLVVEMLVKDGLIEVSSKRGRGGKTVIRLLDDPEGSNEPKESKKLKTEENKDVTQTNSNVIYVDFEKKTKESPRNKDMNTDEGSASCTDYSKPPP